ncbi:hypothetical protein C7N83_09145 [Neisseria iguanae]|uniref:Uncharacterized protein n=1 Tax=Neisseria iguanae TaxID=90242 RepID=A0A2P7TYY2_9NEIS|nr:hypothetical protein C7N83_09145 [Neisseria iguanae]
MAIHKALGRIGSMSCLYRIYLGRVSL